MDESFFNGLFSRRDIAEDRLVRLRLSGVGRSVHARSPPPNRNNPLAAKPPHFKARAKRVIFMYMAGRPVARRHVRLQAQACRPTTARPSTGKGRAQAAEIALQIQPARQERPVVARDLPEPGRTRRRTVPAQQHVHRRRRASQATIEMHTGNFRFRAAVDGGLDAVRPGDREHRAPRVHHDQPAGRSAELRQRVPAGRVPGDQDRQATASKTGAHIANIENPRLSAELQRKQLDLLATLNRERLEEDKVNPDLEGVIESYELAFRMEGAVPQRHGHFGRDGSDAGGLRHRRQGDRQLRPAVPARPAVRRSGRAVHRDRAWAAGTSTTT